MAAGVRAFSITDTGLVREGNEDSFYCGAAVFAVADGLGGHEAGEVASALAVEPVAELDAKLLTDEQQAVDALLAAVAKANQAVLGSAAENPAYRGMGTTLTVALLRDGMLHLAHVGDSRAYLLGAGGELRQLTNDHTVVAELVSEGLVRAAEAGTHPARSTLTRAIGLEDRLAIDHVGPIALQPGDQVLLCSDGLTEAVSEEQIAKELASHDDGDEACRALVAAAHAAGAPDNVTVVLLRAFQPGSAAGGTQPPPA